MTSALALPPPALAVLARARALCAELAPIAHMLPLETPEQEARAATLLRAVDTLDKDVDAQRVAAKAPYLEGGRAVDDEFRAERAELQRIGRMIRKTMAERAQQREQDRRAALEAVRVAPVEAANAILASDPVFAPVEQAHAIVGVSERWTWEATGFEIRAMPVEFLAVDMPKVRAEIAAANREGRPPSIPGVTFERAVTHAVRRLP